jgi:hypothetical protein
METIVKQNETVLAARMFRCIKEDTNTGCPQGTIIIFNENPKYQLGENSRYLDFKFGRGDKYLVLSDCAMYSEFYTEITENFM